ncbi:serine-rich adhesin for platelets-like isoform X1 [Periplaneta americana]|uniref:serine-rich adhesin for platelets-like isoform X1 n=1 Tax=Periplaneta americana TaxID=6978 RepID=UPI0037E892D2
MQWRRKRRVLYVIGSAHHALLIKQYREDGCNGVCSNNEDEADGDRDSTSPLNNSGTSGTSYARASAQQRVPRTKPSTTSSRSGSYNYRHRSYYQQPHDSNQPLVTTEKKTFNEEEYTKITTPRQDVLFKKGYLGRKRPTAAPTADTTANVNNSNTNPENTAADVANGNLNVNGTADQNGEATENDQTTSSDVMSPMEEQPHYIYATNGYVDQTGGPPPGLYYINGSGYELYDPYSGNVTVVVGPAPHYGGPGGGPPVLAAVPCQPLPLQPLEWFNPAFLPYVTAPCHNGLASARDRRKRNSTDSQNCSPQSSESTEPPGSPQECDMDVTPPGPAMYTQAPAYVYPGYMFGPPMYSVNGLTVQGAPTQPPSSDITGSNKRRKKKRRRRRRRGGTEDGCSEESSSDEKELEEPMSVTSQESSSQEIESDSKQSTNTTTVNNDSSSSSPLSSCQTLTPIDHTDTIRISSVVTPALAGEQSSHPNAFDSEISTNEIPPTVNTQKSSPIEQEYISAPSLQKQDVKDTCSEQFSQESDQTKKDKSDYSTNVQLLKDQAEPELESQLVSCTSTHNSLQHTESTQLAADSQDTPSGPSQYSSYDIELSNDYETRSSLSTRVPSPDQSSLENTAIQESVVQCNGDITSSISSENCNKTEDIAKSSKHKKTNKQSNTKSKKNSKGKEEKQQKRPKTSAINSNTDTNQKQNNKKKENGKKDVEEENEIVVSTATQVNSSSQPESSINSIPSDISTQVEAISHQDINQDSSQKILEKHTDLTNGYDGEDTIPSCVLKGSKEVDMEGNEEKKSLPATQEPLHSEEKVQVAGSSSNHGDETSKRDLFPEFMTSSKEPPTRPVRKEKRKSSPSFAPLLTDSDETPKTHIAAKPFELPPISLRPDVPKSEPKTLHEATLSQQLKGTAEILESITAALTREPEVTPQETAHKDSSAYQKSELPTNVLNKDSAETQLSLGSPVSQEKQILSVQSLGDVSAHSAVETEVSKTQEAVPPASVSFMGDRIGDNESDKLTSSQDGNESISEFNKGTGNISEDSTQTADVLPPIPPPRGKKHNTAMKHKLTEHSPAQAWELESGNVTDESSGDSTTSSTTHESEESVIELLSSTHTSPEDKPKQSLSSDEEEDIIFRAKQIQGTDEIVDIKSIPPDKSDVCTPSISGPSLQYSSQISNTDKSSISRTPPTTAKEQMSLNLQGHSRGTKSVHLQHAEMYAEGLSKKIVLEAVSESSKKRMTLPITEAVTRWLRSQSPEVLSLPPTEDETESEISSEDQDQDEKVSDTYQNQHSTGQKNVFCNPLPVPLLEDCHHLSVNDDVNHSGHNDGTGRRVALISVFFEHEHECISEKHDNNGTSVSISKVEGDKRLKNELDDEDSIFLYKNNCISTSLKNTSNSKLDSYNDGESDINQCPKNYTSNRNYNCEHAYSSCKTSEIIPNKCSCNSEINSLKEGMQQEINMKTAKEIVNCNTSVEFYNTSSSLAGTISNTSVAGNQTNNIQERNKSEDEYSFTSDETLECEWDLWDCNPVKPPPPSNTPKNSTITPTEEMLAKSPDDYCSHMCDPAVSVAKYYSLGALQKKSVVFDEDSTDSSDEEVDALKHFQHELEDDDDGLQTSTKPLPNSRFQESDEKMAEGINENKVYGNPEIYKSVYGEAGPRMYIQEDCDRSRNIYNAALSQRAQAAHLFHRKSSVLVSRLKGDGPFPCGGICCILQ